MSLTSGCEQPSTKSNVDRLVAEFAMPEGEGRFININADGFEWIRPSGFDPLGEEKLKFQKTFFRMPFKLPSSDDWHKVSAKPFSQSFETRRGKVTFRTYGHEEGGIRENRFEIETKGIPPIEKYTAPEGVLTRLEKAGEDTWRFCVVTHLRGASQRYQPVASLVVHGDQNDSWIVSHLALHVQAAVNREALPISLYGFAPFGLNNELYFGHTFWDMDVWALPSMLFLQPEAVRQMNKYRLDRATQAEKNAAEFFKKPNSGMMFPWESSVTGKETVRASSIKEHHISGSVLWGLNMSEKAGIASPDAVGKVTAGVGKFFENRSIAGSNGREIKDVMSPDENHIGDNDLYTNLLAQWAMNGRKWEGPTKFKLPKDETSFMTYDADKLRSYKQAAAVLSIFPLQYPEAEKQARTMMERFEGKVSKNGPAMSDAIHATIWARLGEKEKAYDAWKRAWEPFVKGPQMMFSEKRASERTYFYTGAAGCLNTVIYGFAGFRLDKKPLEGALWKKQLKSGWWLSCKPCLPPKWKSLTISPMVIDGQKFSVEITPEKVNIQPAAGS